jgi:hypothetical protein
MPKEPLTVEQILAWADAHHARTGEWPEARSGPVLGEPGETWPAVNLALSRGGRGLPGGSSLVRLLARRRGRLPPLRRPPLTEGRVLAWADLYHARTGRWPSDDSGPVRAAPGESWHAINMALCRGLRGLPGGDTLSRLLRRTGRRR